MYRRRPLIFALLCFVSSAVFAQPKPALPDVLRDWTGWVMDGFEHRECPLMMGTSGDDEREFLCAWPDTLRLDVATDEGQFEQSWNLYADGPVPLPGSESLWPQAVQVNGQSVAVVASENGQPEVWLAAGRHRLTGKLRWRERPETIAIGSRIARIELMVDGKLVFPLQRDANALWLGRTDTATQAADSLDVQVFRRLDDDIPQTLTSVFRLRVSGKGRELAMANVLPADFAPVSLQGPLVARLEGDGSLHVQVRPGTYEMVLLARATQPLAEFNYRSAVEPMPSSEIWSYQARSELRVTDASGPPQIDPVMAEVPLPWRALPAFEMGEGAVLTISERSRGLSLQDQNRLQLNRELWLDFSGAGWRSKDHIQGELVRGWRLDMAPPYRLQRANENGFSLLVTQGAEANWTGIEVRERNLQLEASATLEGDAAILPLTGWQHPFERVSTHLNFPPGYELIAAVGADRADAAWLDRWNLLDVFIAALIVFLCGLALGRSAALIPLGYLLLAWHLPDAPRLSLLCAVAAWLLARSVTQGDALPRWLARAAKLAALVLVLCAVPFMAQQVRLALHPQLESEAATEDSFYDSTFGDLDFGAKKAEFSIANEPMEVPAPPPPPVPIMSAEETNSDSNVGRSNVLGGSFPQNATKMRQRLTRYASNTIVQAGGGEPTWNWRSYQIYVSGPVQIEQEVRLLISPPWMTRLGRLVLSGLLALTLIALLRRLFAKPAVSATRTIRSSSAALLLLLLGLGNAQSSDLPSTELLEALRERVQRLPECTPQCARMAKAEVSARGSMFEAELEIHARERVAFPLPSNDALLELTELRMDGLVLPESLRADDGALWIVLPRGVHRVQLTWRAVSTDSLSLRFPQAPGWIEVRSDDWQASGIDHGQLATGTLEMTRLAGLEAGTARSGVAQRFAPYVMVTRQLRFDLDWSISTTVQRVSPVDAAFSVAIPLLTGERVMSNDMQVADDQIVVAFDDGQNQVQWESRLDAIDTLNLSAPSAEQRAEVWELNVSPTWNVSPSGLPGVRPDSGMYAFHPLPGEQLKLQISRPVAIKGNTLAIDSARLQSVVGKRSSDQTLTLSMRATQGGQHPLGLPEDAEIMALTINQHKVNIRPINGVLLLPITPGVNTISLQWRDAVGAGWRTATPKIALNADASNLDLQLNLPEQRWVIASSGPRVGPAVLYWGELLVMGLLAYALSRTRRTPLRLIDWLLLGVGFSTFSWWALAWFAAWLMLLDWRGKQNPELLRWRFNLIQILLVVLTLVAASALVFAIQTGLLGSPDLHVTGSGSSAHQLHWFHDQTSSELPVGVSYSLPMWLYRLVMLLWAFWLAWALVGWLRWGLRQFTAQAVWRPIFKRKPVVATVDAATPAAENPSQASDSTEDTEADRDRV